MDIRTVGYECADVVTLTAAVQEEYRGLYGGADASQVEPGQFSPPHGRFLVGYVDGRPVAMGGWRRLTHDAGAPGAAPAEIKRMYVVPDARGRGLSRVMLAAIEASASAAGVDWLVLETGLEQPAAVSLYRSSGYADVDGRFGHYYGSPLAVHLGKRLATVTA